MFARVLVANRGEIAVRVLRTLRALGIEAVAVYSDADADAPHVRAADRAVRLGPAPAAESYLAIERVVAAALETGAEAIHPGYGFLSERPDVRARLRRRRPDLRRPVAPRRWRCSATRSPPSRWPPTPACRWSRACTARRSATPRSSSGPARRSCRCCVKAAAGGGGKGMRVVRSHDELPEALGGRAREARAAFGDDRLLVERYVERPRHIEVQVLADAHGTVLHLGERECSLQRRHQKVIEEAPSPVVGAELRERMGGAAVELARSCGYTNAGTVEFIAAADDPSRFFFLEMNARLQVEHPVTEAGHRARPGRAAAARRGRRAAAAAPGRASSCAATRSRRGSTPRTRAPASCPSTGRDRRLREPPAGVRVDSGVEEGTEVDRALRPAAGQGDRPRRRRARRRSRASTARSRELTRARARHERRLPARAARERRGARGRARHRPDRAARRRASRRRRRRRRCRRSRSSR